MRKMIYGKGWGSYLGNNVQAGEIPLPKGWSTPELRDEFVRKGMVRFKEVGFKPEELANVYELPHADVRHKWPAWFYRLYMQVHKESV